MPTVTNTPSFAPKKCDKSHFLGANAIRQVLERIAVGPKTR